MPTPAPDGPRDPHPRYRDPLVLEPPLLDRPLWCRVGFHEWWLTGGGIVAPDEFCPRCLYRRIGVM